ncbi:MAG: hypothetical protein AAFQ63_14500 [Cyanobacteria bacterium J06621_11]
MRLRIFQYFVAFLAIGTLVVGAYDFNLGLAYGFAAACTVGPYYLFGKYLKHKYAYIFIALVFLLTYFIRPLLLIPNKGLFKYLNLSGIDNILIGSSMVEIGLYTACLLFGFCLMSAWSGGQKTTIVPLSPRLTRLQPQSFLLKKRKYIKGFTIAVIIAMAVFNLVLRIGVKKGFASSDILIFIIPELLIHLICITYILKYKLDQGLFCTLLAAIALLGLLSGSKGAFAEIAILVVFYRLQEKGNFKISAAKVIPIIVGGVFALFATFSIANQIRYGILFSGKSLSSEVFFLFAKGGAEAFRPENMLYFTDLVTSRFNGFDGFLATEIYQSDLLHEAFSLGNTARRVIAKLIPFDGGTPTISTGRAVSIEYVGFSADKSFSGAVGLWGTVQLMSQTYGEFIAFGLGASWAWLIAQFQKVKDSDISFVLQGLVMLMIAESIMSGNFDNTVSWFVIRLFQVGFYVCLINLVSAKTLST